VNQTGVGILGDDCRFVVEADPSRSHDIGVNVVEQIINLKIHHTQIEALIELPSNKFEIFGEEEHSLTWGQGYLRWGPLFGQGYTASFD
jgi:hypothetical protein